MRLINGSTTRDVNVSVKSGSRNVSHLNLTKLRYNINVCHLFSTIISRSKYEQ